MKNRGWMEKRQDEIEEIYKLAMRAFKHGRFELSYLWLARATRHQEKLNNIKEEMNNDALTH